MTHWAEFAACRDHRDPELWFPRKADDPATEARRICHEECPVRLECGADALSRNEQDGVAGGYRMWEADDLDQLRAELPHIAARYPKPKRQTATCSDCGRLFGTTRGLARCKYCRMGLVPAEPVRDTLNELRKIMSTDDIGAATGIAPTTLSGIVSRTRPPDWVKATTAQRVRAFAASVQVSA